MYNCKYCNKEFDKPNKAAGHITWCNFNPNKSKILEDFKLNNKFLKEDKENFQCRHCNEILLMNVKQFGIHTRWCHKNPNRKFSKKRNYKKENGVPYKHSEETRKIISEKRKAYLAKNKGEHPWSRYSNSESEPEKNFRVFAEKVNIPLVQYYTPPESNRFFEMDFANLENKICFEINGNQHYLEDRKTLAPYYQERHDHFTSLGWKVLEIHYSICFKESNIEAILKESFLDFQKCENKIQEISNGRLERKKQKLLLKEQEAAAKKQIKEKEKQEKALLPKVKVKRVRPKKVKVRFDSGFSKKPLTQKEIDFAIKNRKVTRPTKEELHQMLWSMPSTKIALHFGVSDKCIEKWAKGYGLSKPPRGHWMKEAAKKATPA